MIDFGSERLISFATAAREFPGGPVHVTTLQRWRSHGIRGVRLETILRGGARYTSREAIERFINATTAAGEQPSEPC